MTKAEALYKFFASFSLVAYEADSVPNGDAAPEFPYITYSLATDSLGTEVPLSMNLWYRDKPGHSALPDVVRKAEYIGRAIGYGGTLLKCDGGTIWLKRGMPFVQYMGDPDDDLIRRAYINITTEFMTAD